MFSDFNPIFQVVGVHPGRGGEGASNDGLQGLDHFLFGFVFFKAPSRRQTETETETQTQTDTETETSVVLCGSV